MTRDLVDESIRDFLKILVYEAQLIAFQRKLLQKIIDSEVKEYASSELKLIAQKLKGGKYLAESNAGGLPHFKSHKQGAAKADNTIKETKRSKEKTRVETPGKQMTSNWEKKDIDFSYKTCTYKELVEKTQFPMRTIETALRNRGLEIALNHESFITDEVWSAIGDFILNKLKLIASAKAKEEFDKRYVTRLKPVPSSTPLPKYIGGNFGKLIYTGKTS